MNKPPSFQFYADDFLAGTMLMTDAEVGKYIRALCIQWNRGGLTGDDLVRLGLTVVDQRLDSGSCMVATKFQLDTDGLWKNSRLEVERTKQKEYRERQSEKGKASAKARFNRGSTVVQPSGEPNVNSPSPSPSPSSIEDSNKNLRRGTLEEVRQWFAEKQLPESDAEYFFHRMESSDWTVKGEKVKRWRSTVSSWKAANYFPSQKQLAASKPTPKPAVFGRDFI